MKDGFATTLYAMNTDPNPRIAQAIQQDLAAVGIKAEIKAEAQAQVIAGRRQQGPRRRWCGRAAWAGSPTSPTRPISTGRSWAAAAR